MIEQVTWPGSSNKSPHRAQPCQREQRWVRRKEGLEPSGAKVPGRSSSPSFQALASPLLVVAADCSRLALLFHGRTAGGEPRAHMLHPEFHSARHVPVPARLLLPVHITAIHGDARFGSAHRPGSCPRGHCDFSLAASSRSLQYDHSNATVLRAHDASGCLEWSSAATRYLFVSRAGTLYMSR